MMTSSRFLPAVVIAAATLSASVAYADGFDRSDQSIGFIFEKGIYADLSLGWISPLVSGNDIAGFGGGATGDVAKNFVLPSASIKADMGSFSLGLMLDTPFGAGVRYGPGSVGLGGTKADLNSVAVTGVARYKLTNQFSVIGGVRAERFGGDIGLVGQAFGALNGYAVSLDDNIGVGFLVGGAFEMPDSGLRVSLVYNSRISHGLDTAESVGGVPVFAGATTVKTPQSVNFDFRAPVTSATTVFGGVRWVDWSEFDVSPAFFRGATTQGIVGLKDTFTYTLGVEHQFNQQWSGSLALQYRPKTGDLVSPLIPTNGHIGVTVAAGYRFENMKVTGSFNYTKFGNAMPETGTPDIARASMSGSSIGAGIKLSFWR